MSNPVPGSSRIDAQHFAPYQQLFEPILEFSLYFNTTLAKKLIESGIDAIIVGEDIADIHGPFIYPGEFKVSILPYLEREISEIKRSGVKVILHSYGYTTPLFEDLVKLGMDG